MLAVLCAIPYDLESTMTKTKARMIAITSGMRTVFSSWEGEAIDSYNKLHEVDGNLPLALVDFIATYPVFTAKCLTVEKCLIKLDDLIERNYKIIVDRHCC